MDCNLDELHYMFDSTFFAESRYRFIPEYYLNGNSHVKLQLIMSTSKARKMYNLSHLKKIILAALN